MEESLKRLLLQKPLNKITISDIIKSNGCLSYTIRPIQEAVERHE